MQIILQEFYRIAEVPRPHHEGEIGDYLMHTGPEAISLSALSGMSSAMSSMTTGLRRI